MISMDETNSHNWGERPKGQSAQILPFTAGCRTDGEQARNDPLSCKTLLRVAAVQFQRLDAADRAAARPYVERLIAAAERDLTVTATDHLTEQ